MEFTGRSCDFIKLSTNYGKKIALRERLVFPPPCPGLCEFRRSWEQVFRRFACTRMKGAEMRFVSRKRRRRRESKATRVD